MKKINTMWIKENKDYPGWKERSTDTGQREKRIAQNLPFFSVFIIKEEGSVELSEININEALGISSGRLIRSR